MMLNLKYFYLLLFFDILCVKCIRNEISIIMNKTYLDYYIIDHSYYSDISNVVINGITASIYNYSKLLNQEINNVTFKFNKYLNTTESMFGLLHNILYIDMSNFVSLKVTNTVGMFASCIRLKSLNLNNFDTSLVTNMFTMFRGCYSLESLNLSNFNTSSVTNMRSMFEFCFSLISLDITNFDTKSVTDMNYMFCSCESLQSLDINN